MNGTRLERGFYARPTLIVARELIGKVLVHRTAAGPSAGRIVEVEAYIGEDDPACHAAPGPTPRNQPLYGLPGVAYVYLNYGIHFLTNVVTEPEGAPAAVLLRALEPLDGVTLMHQRRAKAGGLPAEQSLPAAALCRGPGNLSKAMGIDLRQNRADLVGRHLWIEDRGLEADEVAWGPRIGLTVGTERLWRCYDVGSDAVSGPRGRARVPSRERVRSARRGRL